MKKSLPFSIFLRNLIQVVVAHTFNPSTWIWERQVDLFEFKVNLVYRESSRTARATHRNLISKNKTYSVDCFRGVSVGKQATL